MTETATCCGTCGRSLTYEPSGKAFEMHWYGGHHDCAECNTPRETCSRCKWMAERYGPNWETEPISSWAAMDSDVQCTICGKPMSQSMADLGEHRHPHCMHGPAST